MANRRVLVKRRKAVRNIRKITRTMQLIATARFQSALNRATASRPYADKLAELVADLSEVARDVKHDTAVVYGSLATFAVSGFCAMAYEVIWTRLLALIVGPTTYAFTIVLVTFIVGLALGSMIFGWLADRTGKPAWILVLTQILAAACALAISQVLGNSQLFFARLIETYQHDFALLSLAEALFLLLFMLPSTVCLGATFPTVTKIVTRSASGVGRSVGVAYAINTIGAVAGSFCAGFLLIPAFGKAGSLSLVVAVQLLMALILCGWVISQGMVRTRTWFPAMALGVLVTGRSLRGSCGGTGEGCECSEERRRACETKRGEAHEGSASS